MYLLASILQYSQQLYVNKKDTHVTFKSFIKKIPEKSTLLLDWLFDVLCLFEDVYIHTEEWRVIALKILSLCTPTPEHMLKAIV